MNFLSLPYLSLLFLAQSVSGIFIYVASDNGNITTLSLDSTQFVSSANSSDYRDGFFVGSGPDSKMSLSIVATTNTTAKAPAWLTLNKHNNLLYLTDGTTTGNGTLEVFRTSATGELTSLDHVEALIDGAHSVFYANGRALAVAHYSASALQTYKVDASGAITPLETFTYTIDKEGPDGERQAASHPHESVVDPTENYLLVNDLGADLVRVYYINQDNFTLGARESLVAAPGSGPRHGVFGGPYPSEDGTGSHYIYYLCSEIAGTVTAYQMTYLPNNGGLNFTELPGGSNYSTLAPGVPFPEVTKAGGPGVSAEPRITPDGKFLLISNRRDESFTASTAVFPPNGTSDSMVMFRIRDDLGGRLDFVQTVPAGGAVPRSWDLNTAGTLSAIGLELSSKVQIIERSPCTNLWNEAVASIDVEGEIFAVVFDQ